MTAKMPTFEEAWAKKEAEGYQYGEDALEGVRFGWEIAMAEMASRPRTSEATKCPDCQDALPHRYCASCARWEGHAQGRAEAIAECASILEAFETIHARDEGLKLWPVRECLSKIRALPAPTSPTKGGT